MQASLEWLSSLPIGALYAVMGVLAAVENIFPPIPADTIVALGSFLAGQGQGTALGAFVVTWAGNIVGAMIMYTAGRKFGTRWMEKWMRRAHTDEKYESRLEILYAKYGLAALALSRFIPGVRALVPPFAGAMKLPAFRVFLVLAVPSGIWYGVITYLAFHMGSNVDTVLESVKSAQNWMAGVAVVIVASVVIAWLVLRKRRRSLD